MILKPIGDIFALLSIFFLVFLIIGTILSYQNYHFAKSEEFLKGVDNITNVTWGEYPDGYYDKDGYPNEEEEHKLESQNWDNQGWTKIK